MKKAVIYARYSCERQTEQSIEGQLRVCQEFAEKNDILIIDTYIDRATTGTNDNRAAFQTMLKDAEKPVPWDIVLVYALDRFGRNSIEVAVNKQKLRKNNKLLISATQRTSENIDGSKNLDGILLENVYIGLAEYYSAELSQKIRRGMNESRQKRQYTGGFVLFGYDVKDKKYVINETEAEIVRQVYADYANGRIVKDICKELAERGIKNKFGRPFVPNTIYRMLRLEKYIGIVRYGDDVFENTLPPIVDMETYAKVQSIIAANKRAPSRRKSYGKFFLSGKLYCGECGSLMTGDSGTSHRGVVYFYYTCFDKKRRKGCTMPSVQKDDIENTVFKVCCDVLESGFIPAIVDTAYAIQMEELASNITVINLQAQLKEKEKALRNILRAIEDGIYTSTTKQRLEELEKDVETIKSKIEVETIKQQQVASKEDYAEFLKQFIGRQVKNEDFKESLFELLIRKVVLFRDKIRITFNFSPDKGKSDDNIDVDAAEIQEAQKEYNGCVIADKEQKNNPSQKACSGSDYSLLAERARINLNHVFIRKEYFGVWVIYKKKIGH